MTLHYSDGETDYPVTFELWRPPDVDKIDHGLTAADVPLKASKQELKSSDPAAWRAYLLGVWRRHQDEPVVTALYESKIRMAERFLTDWVTAHPDLHLPFTFDSWYTTPDFCRYLDQELKLPYVGTLAEDTLVRSFVSFVFHTKGSKKPITVTAPPIG